MNKKGTLFLCQTPGEWGKLPGPSSLAIKGINNLIYHFSYHIVFNFIQNIFSGFKNFWDADTIVYLTQDTNRNGFKFDASKAKQIKYTHATPV